MSRRECKAWMSKFRPEMRCTPDAEDAMQQLLDEVSGAITEFVRQGAREVRIGWVRNSPETMGYRIEVRAYLGWPAVEVREESRDAKRDR